MTAYQTDIPDPACSEVTMSVWLSMHGLVVFSQKTLQLPVNLSPNLNSPCHHTQAGQFKATAGMLTPANFLTAVQSITSVHLLWQTQNFKIHEIL